MSRRLINTAFFCAIGLLATGGIVHVAQADPAPQPNVVFVLVDDFSENLLPYMSEVQALANDGVTFSNYFNATPWCCPSRASTQTGNYPHTTGVRGNVYPGGGFMEFLKTDMASSIGVQMQDNGYRTGLMGKYLNGYSNKGQSKAGLPGYPANFVPPGWDDWFANAAYQHFAYTTVDSVDDGPGQTIVTKGNKAANYFTDVMSARAQTFIRADHAEPFFLMLDTFAPHTGIGLDPQGRQYRYPPAPRDRADTKKRPASWGPPEFAGGDCGLVACADVVFPDPASALNFNVVTTNPLEWASHGPLSAKNLEVARLDFIQRIQMLQSVNDMLAGVRRTLDETGKADNTWIFFASDNGYHLGEHALLAGKTTPYDNDIKVPMIVHPPGGTGAPVSIGAFAQNVDVLPTLVDVAGGPTPENVEGMSLLPLISDPSQGWRSSVLLELTNSKKDDQDRQMSLAQQSDITRRRFNPDTVGVEGDHVAPTYNAIRTAEYLYVDFSDVDGQLPTDTSAEFYDLTVDPGEVNNIYWSVPAEFRVELDAELNRQITCAGVGCWDEQLQVPILYPTDPTDTPTGTPTDTPTGTPTEPPTEPPTESPTEPPTESPTGTPTEPPTESPTGTPSEPPTSPPAP